VIKFKTNRQRAEREVLEQNNNQLFEIVSRYDEVVSFIWGKDTTITDIYRTNDEHRRSLKTVLMPYYPTVHEYWRGVDIRDSLTINRKRVMEMIINEQFIYDRPRPHKKVLLYHNIGLGMHAHIQNHRNTAEQK